jgi:hypothetical protein
MKKWAIQCLVCHSCRSLPATEHQMGQHVTPEIAKQSEPCPLRARDNVSACSPAFGVLQTTPCHCHWIAVQIRGTSAPGTLRVRENTAALYTAAPTALIRSAWFRGPYELQTMQPTLSADASFCACASTASYASSSTATGTAKFSAKTKDIRLL